MKGTRIVGYLSAQEMADKCKAKGIKPGTRAGVIFLINGDKIGPVEHFGKHYLIPWETFYKFVESR